MIAEKRKAVIENKSHQHGHGKSFPLPALRTVPVLGANRVGVMGSQRDYARVSCRFWIGETGRMLRGDSDAQVMALYLITCASSNMYGLYYLPMVTIAHELGKPLGRGFEGPWKALQRGIEVNFCDYDTQTEMVWVKKMAFYQIERQLSERDHRVSAAQKFYDGLPNGPFLGEFFDMYSEYFHLKNRRESTRPPEFFDKPLGSPLEGARKPLRSQEQEQEQEQETGTGENNKPLSSSLSRTSTALVVQQPTSVITAPPSEAVIAVFDHYRKYHPRSFPKPRASSKEARLIKARIADGYTVADICQAIDGIHLTPFNLGENDKGQKYLDLALVVRDASHLQRYQQAATAPAQPKTHAQLELERGIAMGAPEKW